MRRLHRYFILAALPAALVTAALSPPLKTVHAMLDETQAVHIDASEIENGTLIIGTYLIYLGALDDEIYSLAQQSATDSGQTEMYYKSELGDGAWFAINDAASLTDITAKGNPVEKEVIDRLYFTYHTKSDGITYDLRTEQPINVYDIMNPYNLETMPELEELRNQMEILKKNGTDVSILEAFFNTGMKEDTKELDKQLQALYGCKLRLMAAGTPKDKTEMVDKAMDKVDAERRYEAEAAVRDSLNALMDRISSSPVLSAISDLQVAAGNCLKKLQSSMDANDAKGLKHTEDSALSAVEQTLVQELLSAVDSKDDAALGALLEEMESLYHIMDGLSIRPDKEKALLDSRIIPKAKQIVKDTGSSTAKNELEYYEKLRAQMDKAPEGNGEWKELSQKKQSLQKKRLSALDKNNLTEAKKVEDQIEAVDKKIKKLEAEGIYGSDSIKKNMQVMKEDAQNGGEEGSTSATIEKAVNEVEGASLDINNSEENSAALAGLAEFCRQADQKTDSPAYTLLKAKAESAASKKEGYVFKNLRAAQNSSYVPVDKLAKFKSFRYVWNHNQKKAILAKKSIRYEFTAFSDVVGKNGKKAVNMGAPALFQKVLYLPGAYAEKEFSCKIYKLEDTGYSVIIDSETLDKASKICDSITEHLAE